MMAREPDSPIEPEALERLNRLAWLLDNAIRIPGTRFRIGLDPLIGLVPGIGDAVAALLSMIIIGEAARARLPASVLMRMAFNVAIEVLIGAIPVIGDLFDMTWKANARNTRLMEQYLASSRSAAAASRVFVAVATGILLAVVAAAVVVGFLVLRRLWYVLLSR